MKRFYLLLLMLIGAVGLFGCDSAQKLEKPTNVTISGDIVSWDAVTGAESYIVVVNSTEHVVTTTSFDLSTLNLAAGTYSVTVVAKKGAQVSLPTTAINYVVEGSTLTLSAPIVNLTGNILTWQAVTNATGYQVIVNSTIHTTTQTTFDLSTLSLAPGTYSITVKATAGVTLSQASAAKSYTVISVENRDLIYGNLLKAINPLYEPDMDETDFENEFEFKQYQRMETMVNLYLDVAISEGMDPIEMVSMMNFMVELPMVFEEPDPSEIKDELDKLGDYGMSPQIFASFVLSLGSEALTIAMDDMTNELTEREIQLSDRSGEISTIMAGTDFQNMIQELQAYVSVTDIGLFGQFLVELPQLDISRIIYFTREYNSSLLYQYPADLSYYYNNDGTDVYLDLFQRIVNNIALENDTELMNAINNYYPSFFDPLWAVQGVASDLMYYQDRIDEINRELEMMGMIIDMLENEPEHIRTIIEEVATYIQTVYQAIPSTLITDIEALLQSGELTPEEVLIIKDEIITILIDTIPDESSFELFFETFVTLAGTIAGYNVTPLTAHATTVAQLQRNSILLGLEFILSIDVTTVNDIMTITDGMVTPSYYDEFEDIYYEEQVDASQVVDLVIYVLTYVDNFLTEQATLVSAIEAIDVNPMVTDFVGFAVAIVKSQLENEMDPTLYPKVAALLDATVVAMPDYIEFYEMVYAMDKTLIDHIIDTEGQMLKDLAIFIETEEKNPEIVLNFIESMIDHVMGYRALIRTDIDEEFVTLWVELMRLPLQGVCLETGIDDDCDGIFTDIKPYLIDVIMNVLEVEDAIMTEINSVSNIYAQINTWGVEFETGLMIHVILSLKDVVDQERVLIETTVGIVIDNILGNTDLQALMGIDPQMLTDIETNILEGIAHVDSETDRIALFNFANLTEQQELDIQAFFDMFFGNEPKEPVIQ